MKEIHTKNNIITSAANKNNHYQNSFNLAEEFADKSTLPVIRRGLKDMDPATEELSASLIRKFQ